MSIGDRGALTWLGLGTVQFGVDYGVTNRTGRTSPEEVARILAMAEAAGGRVLDTAPRYGTSEQALGESGKLPGDFRVVTKTGRQPEVDVAETVRRDLVQSLTHLRVERVHGLLEHHPPALLSNGGDETWAAFEELRSEGLVERIGVSVYDPEELTFLRERFRPTLVQAPLNALDRRFAESLRRAVAEGVEVHIRSVFLQGVLLAEPVGRGLPAELVAAAAAFRVRAEEVGVSPAAACLAVVRDCVPEAVLLVGVTSVNEMEQILAAARQSVDPRAFDGLAVGDPSLTDPRQWSTKR